MPTIRGYEPRDLDRCRELWVELTQRHRDIYVEAIRSFHRLGFDILAHVQLQLDLVHRERDPWVADERLAERDFRF